MRRKVFFSFCFIDDASKAAEIRITHDSFEPKFHGPVDWDALKARGDAAVKAWVAEQLEGCAVTIVLIGANTYMRPWVQAEIRESNRRGLGMFGIQMTGMSEPRGILKRLQRFDGLDPFTWNGLTGPLGQTVRVPIVKWLTPKGDSRTQLPTWIDRAAKNAGR